MNTNPAIMLIEAERDAIKAALAESEARVREQRASLKAMEDALSVLAGASPNASVLISSKAAPAGPKLKDLVKDIIHGADRGLRASDILRELSNHNRPTDLNSLLSTLSRLKGAEEAFKHEDRCWYSKPPSKGDEINFKEF